MDEFMKKSDDELEIDLGELVYVLFKKIWVIILCFGIGLVLAAGGTKLFITPMYQSSAMIYILGNATNISGINLQLTQQLTVDFEILATSRPVVNKAIALLDKDYTYDQVIDMVTIENPTESSILKITAESPDPEEAAALADAMASATASQVADVMDMDEPTTVEEATVPTRPSSPNLLKNSALGALAGAFLAAAYITIRFIMNDTIKTAEDARKYLNVNTLAAIPKEKKLKIKKSA